MHSHIRTLIEIIKQTVDREIVSIILFGSVATGHFKEGSDIDILIIVKEYNEPVCKEYWRQIKKNSYQAIGIPVDPIFAEERALDDITSSFYLDVIADGKVIYGKDVLDRNIFKRHNILPITTGGVRIGWRISDVIKHQPLEKSISLLKNQ
ncbi:MAG: nucleotidyltransferase domain-containing protein [Euryarchaeota archaeon]|nr:nucleotidyltransferase domain-containing protein [Euryarchaeota archaeon]